MLAALKRLFAKQATAGAGGYWTFDADVPTRVTDEALVDLVSRNVVAYRAVTETAAALAGVDAWVRQRTRGGEVDRPDLTEVLRRPHPLEPGRRWWQHVATDYVLLGNAYVARRRGTRRTWLVRLPSSRVEHEYTGGRLTAYVVRAASGRELERYPVAADGSSDCLHLRVAGPTDDRGRAMPPLASALQELLQYQAAARLTTALLERGGFLGGIFKVEEGATEAAVARLVETVREQFSGAAGWGRYAVLEGAEFQPLRSSPQDFGVDGLRAFAARLIAQAVGYPPYLLGLPEGATYANVAEARAHWWEATVAPQADYLYSSVAAWLWPDLDVWVEVETSDSTTTEQRARTRWQRHAEAVRAGILTPNEARMELGWDRLEGGDVLVVPPTAIPVRLEEPDAGA